MAQGRSLGGDAEEACCVWACNSTDTELGVAPVGWQHSRGAVLGVWSRDAERVTALAH